MKCDKPNHKRPQNFLNNSVQFLYSFSCAFGLYPSSHILHFFSFTQSSQSLRLCSSSLLCSLCFLTSPNSLSLATHRPHSLSRHMLTHLRGAQPLIINYGEGKLNHFHYSLKSLNVFSFWIDFLILWIYDLAIIINNIVYCSASANIIFNCLCVWFLKKLNMSLTHYHLDECLMFTVFLDILNRLEF